LVHRKASQQASKQCLTLAMNDIAVFQKEIDEHDDKIDKKEDDVNREIKIHSVQVEMQVNVCCHPRRRGM
jgi:hypothetical protein